LEKKKKTKQKQNKYGKVIYNAHRKKDRLRKLIVAWDCLWDIYIFHC